MKLSFYFYLINVDVELEYIVSDLSLMKSFWNMQNDLLLFIINQITIVIHTPQLIYSKIIKTSMFFSFLLLEYSRNYIFEKYLRRVWRKYLISLQFLFIRLKIIENHLENPKKISVNNFLLRIWRQSITMLPWYLFLINIEKYASVYYFQKHNSDNF